MIVQQVEPGGELSSDFGPGFDRSPGLSIREHDVDQHALFCSPGTDSTDRLGGVFALVSLHLEPDVGSPTYMGAIEGAADREEARTGWHQRPVHHLGVASLDVSLDLEWRGRRQSLFL